MAALHRGIRDVCQFAADVDADAERFPMDWMFHYRWVAPAIMPMALSRYRLCLPMLSCFCCLVRVGAPAVPLHGKLMGVLRGNACSPATKVLYAVTVSPAVDAVLAGVCC